MMAFYRQQVIEPAVFLRYFYFYFLFISFHFLKKQLTITVSRDISVLAQLIQLAHAIRLLVVQA